MIELIWDRPDYLLNGEIHLPRVYDGAGPIPPECNAVTIKLDGTAKADLSWKEERAIAQELVEKGYNLFWEIDLGLFDRLALPLHQQGQFLALTLSLEHFRDTLWKAFKDQTLGLVIYRGDVDFSTGFSWDEQQKGNLKNWLQTVFQDVGQFALDTGLSLTSFEEADPAYLAKNETARQLVRLFCRDAAVEYLSLLAARLPDALPCYLWLDAKAMQNPLHEAQLLNPERYDLLNVVVKNGSLPWAAWTWQGHRLQKNPSAKVQVGVCFPPMEMFRAENYAGLYQAFELLLEQKIPFKIIAENHLITCWDGLDYLIYVPAGLSPQGKRKLHGFCAAGGTVVTLGPLFGLANEVRMEGWRERTGC